MGIDSNKLKKVFKDIVIETGKIVMEIYNRDDLDIRGPYNSPQTEADRQASSYMISELKKEFPEIGVISEEDKETWENVHKEKFFLIDPIDGTKEFIKKTGEFTINIGLISNKKPVAGVVYAPAIDELYLAGDQNSAELNDEEINTRTPSKEGLDIMVSRSHLDEDKMRDFLSDYKIRSFIKAGSSLKICRVAAGKADLYPRLGPTMEWDIAAAHAVLNAAGGKITKIDGSDFNYGKETLKNTEFIASGF